MRCEAETKAGTRCKAPALHGEPHCFHHSPTRAAERTDARRRGGLSLHYGDGGKVERPEARIREVGDVLDLLETAAGDALARKPSVQRARVLVYIAGSALKALETADLAERVAALEARLTMRGSA